ncbi:DUF6247 family protein [Amycolatopsis sp. NPDC004079]|uniref:DUF6247 family protein n=1 Tax=Amycolatopsis sp. NPDC004079 TaxID=3154549 RepID=UPI0033A7E93F
MTAARDIPGLVVDDSPDRPPYRPRVTFERSVVSVRAALRATNADDLAEFEREFIKEMVEAEDSDDVTPVHGIVNHWYGRGAGAPQPGDPRVHRRRDRAPGRRRRIGSRGGTPVSCEVRCTTRAARAEGNPAPEGQQALTGLEKKLGKDPWSAGREGKPTGSWRASLGRYGDAQYVIGPSWRCPGRARSCLWPARRRLGTSRSSPAVFSVFATRQVHGSCGPA